MRRDADDGIHRGTKKLYIIVFWNVWPTGTVSTSKHWTYIPTKTEHRRKIILLLKTTFCEATRCPTRPYPWQNIIWFYILGVCFKFFDRAWRVFHCDFTMMFIYLFFSTRRHHLIYPITPKLHNPVTNFVCWYCRVVIFSIHPLVFLTRQKKLSKKNEKTQFCQTRILLFMLIPHNEKPWLILFHSELFFVCIQI